MLEFSSLMNSVKPKLRTHQFSIIAALYYLETQTNPVTTKQIKDLLELHGSNTSDCNLNALLRSYSKYVEPVKGNKNLNWHLTKSGVQFLQEKSNLSITDHSAADHINKANYDYDVAFICALQHPELTFLIEALGEQRISNVVDSSQHTHICQRTDLVTQQNNKIKLVITKATSMGLTSAAIATTQIIMRFHPRLVIMVGIAAGTRDANKEFGDVLVADPSIDYNSGKVAQKEGVREFLPDPYPIGLNPRLRSILQKYQGNNKIFELIRNDWHGKLPEKPNRLHIGPLGASDQVIDDPSRIIEIQKNWRKLIGVEMETYGVYRACHEAPEPKPRFVSLKSVCDFAAEKSDSWQNFAAFTSSQFAVRFLKTEWESIWPQIT